MDGYLVDIAELGGLVDDLAGVAQQIVDANAALRGVAPSGLGSAAIDAAGARFQERWEHGTGKVADAAEAMVGSLRQTQRDYERIEQEVARLFATGGPSHDNAADGDPAPPPEGRITRALDGVP